ncbi:MAG: sigma-54-dependent Fis family transcriptional regulator, partial [Gemmatimonadetes bacterium]|nr:sigma-54-dependent Fis family transcriptional regulator [Gemmatimonadota bacterium]
MSHAGLRLIVVDDEPRQREIVADILEDEGHTVEAYGRADEVLARLKRGPVDLLITDLRMPGTDGLELLRAAREEVPELLIILMTAFATVDSAVQAMKDGAFDYLQKPFSRDQLVSHVRRAAAQRALMRENTQLRKRLRHDATTRILGESPAIVRFRKQLDRVAAGRADVLVLG